MLCSSNPQQNISMKLILISVLLLFSLTNAVTVGSLLTDLQNDNIRRCPSPDCDVTFIKQTINYLLFACKNGGCAPEFVLRTTPLGSTAHIQQYCVISEPFHSPNWSLRIQADLIAEGARMVAVAVPRASRLEQEFFARPFVLSIIIPRNQLFLINAIIKMYCGSTN